MHSSVLFTPSKFALWLFILVWMVERKFCCVYSDEYVTMEVLLWTLAHVCERRVASKIEVCSNIFLLTS